MVAVSTFAAEATEYLDSLHRLIRDHHAHGRPVSVLVLGPNETRLFDIALALTMDVAAEQQVTTYLGIQVIRVQTPGTCVR